MSGQPPNPPLQSTASRARSFAFWQSVAMRLRRLNARAFGVRGGVIDIPFFMWMQRISLLKGPFCQSRGVLVPVVLRVV